MQGGGDSTQLAPPLQGTTKWQKTKAKQEMLFYQSISAAVKIPDQHLQIFSYWWTLASQSSDVYISTLASTPKLRHTEHPHEHSWFLVYYTSVCIERGS